MLIGLIMVVGAAVVSTVAIALVLRHAARLGLVQSPNERSSHVRPTPTGGGVGIILGGTLAGLFIVSGDWRLAVVLLAALGFGLLGLWDDVRPLSPGLRLPVQIVLVALTLVFGIPLGALESALGWTIAVPFLLTLLAIGIVYWVNLFNFMDGIDGIAGSEALFLLLAPVGLTLASGPAAGGTLFWWPVSLAAAVVPLVVFNWQPARVFMGDTGSMFLGFIVAALALLQIASGQISCWEILILAACFVTDGTVTLLRRALRGEAIMTAHRRHAYQRLARRFGSHQSVVLAVTAINILWLLPLAVAAHLQPQGAPLLAVFSYVPLVGLVLVAGAGRPEHV